MKYSTLAKIYIVAGTMVSLWFFTAAANGWKAPNLGVIDGMGSGGRGSGGFWGGGK